MSKEGGEGKRPIYRGRENNGNVLRQKMPGELSKHQEGQRS